MDKLFWQVEKLFLQDKWENYFGGKIVLAGGKIILAGGKIVLAGGKIILAGGKIILAGLVTTRQSHPVRVCERVNSVA